MEREIMTSAHCRTSADLFRFHTACGVVRYVQGNLHACSPIFL